MDLAAWVVVSSASASLLSGLIFATLCYRASQTPSSLGALPLLQFLLANLGVADAIFSLSFILAQGRDSSASGGFICQLSAFLNEWGGMTSSWWTVAYGWFIREALLHGGRQRNGPPWNAATRSRLHWRLMPFVWGVPLAYEALAFPFFYIPDGIIGPDATEPWCHWRDLDEVGVEIVSTLVYSNVVVALLFVLWAYADLIVRQHLRSSAHRRLLAATAATAHADALPAPAAAVASVWCVDARLASYLGAFAVAQTPSVIHRALQIIATSPSWLASVQLATQPAQGLLNALVFLHHTRFFRADGALPLFRCGADGPRGCKWLCWCRCLCETCRWDDPLYDSAMTTDVGD